MSQNDVDALKQPIKYQVLIPQDYCGNRQNDEISLIDLFLILWRKKFWIIGLTGIITVISIFHALSLTPVYEATAYLLPPREANIEILNLFAARKETKDGKLENIYTHTTITVYKQAMDNLKSRKYQWMFFNQNNLVKLYVKEPVADIRPRDVFNESFNPHLKVDVEKGKEKDGERKVSFTYSDKQEVVRLLNQYIAFVNKVTVQALLAGVNGRIQFEKRQIEQKIEQLRRNALLQRQDTIQQIKEQLHIARKLNIQTNKLTGRSLTSSDRKEAPRNYLEGVNALQVKLDSLSNRKSDDPYIAELRPLQARLTILGKAKIDGSQIRAFNIDQAAQEPKYPIKPKKRPIVVIGFVIGVMLSVFAVFIWHFIEKYRQEQGL